MSDYGGDDGGDDGYLHLNQHHDPLTNKNVQLRLRTHRTNL